MWSGKRGRSRRERQTPEGHLYDGEATPYPFEQLEDDAVDMTSVPPPAAVQAPAPTPTATTAEAPPPPPATPTEPAALALAEPIVIGTPPLLREPRLTKATSPYRPDTVIDGGEAFGMIARAGTVRGRDKRDGGGPRQDDICLSVVDAHKAIVVAIADGMGSAQRAHLGAALATRHAIEEVEAQLVRRPPAELDWPGLFTRAAQALVVAHRQSIGDRDDHTPRAVSRDLGTTLTVAVVWADNGTTRFDVAAIGDSPAWVLDEDRWSLLIGEANTDEAFEDSSVVALPYVGTPQRAGGTLVPGQVLVLGSDGFGRPLDDGRNDLGTAFAAALKVPPPLIAWAQLVDFGRRTYSDDRTIAAIWPPPGDLA